ncbi:NUDIX domain-containing protein [Propionicimonas sp.]|uniref:NUDIX domain-containing protein n=1 Tax=Propionicimonas sp. TaxID=1955623 RepID=UPI0039E22162
MHVLAAEEVTDRPLAWPVVSHQVRGSGAVSDFVNDAVQVPDGGLMNRQYLLHPGAVGVVAWDAEDRIAVVRQYRHPVSFELLEPPAGLLDADGESWLAAAQRELAEEAGLQAGDWRVLVDVFTSPGAGQESLRIYLARELAAAPVPDGFVAHDEEAHMEVAWAERRDLVAAILAGRLENPTMVSGVLALEVARLSGRLDDLRAADAPWPARAARDAHNAELAGLDGHAG